MIRYLLAALLAGAVLGLASNAHAWSFSADVPTQFTLADKDLDSAKSAKADKKTSTDLSGFLLSLSGTYVGIGYEQYRVSGNAKANTNPGTINFKYALNFQLYDVMVTFPMKYLNTTLGYGAGQVNPLLSSGQGTVPHIDAAHVTQAFLRLGIPLGEHFDVHVGYHALNAEDAKVHQQQPDKIKTSGQTLTAGVRLAW